MGAIEDFVVVKIVKAGITWLISALNPAAAFIKACKMIYDVVMFFVEKGSQIKEFVDSVLDSIESIAGGGVGAVAKYIEDTLARILPLLLGFLASLLGLGGISEKIKEILEKVQKPVKKAIDFVINGALKLARPIINLVKRGAGWVKGKVAAGKAWVKGKVEGARSWARGKVDAAKGRLGLSAPDPTTASTAVKEAARHDLASAIGPEVSDGPATMAKVRAIYARHRPAGLKYIDIRSTGRVGEFQAYVSASPEEPALKFVHKDFQTGIRVGEKRELERARGDGTPEDVAAAEAVEDRRLGERRQPAHVACTATFNGVAVGRFQSAGIHAEEKMMAAIEAGLTSGKLTKAASGKTSMSVQLTRSPCGSCGPKLIAFAARHNLDLSLQIMGLYHGTTHHEGGESKTPEEKAAQRQVSIDVLKALRAANVQLSVLTVQDIVEKHYADSEVPLDEVEKKSIARRVKALEPIIAKINSDAEAMTQKVGG